MLVAQSGICEDNSRKHDIRQSHMARELRMLDVPLSLFTYPGTTRWLFICVAQCTTTYVQIVILSLTGRYFAGLDRSAQLMQ